MKTDWTTTMRFFGVRFIALRAIAVLSLALMFSACTIVTGSVPRPTDDASAANFNAQLGQQHFQRWLQEGDRGDLEIANEKLDKALDQDSNNSLAHITMARLQFAIDKPEVARGHYKRALAIEPDNADNRNAYGIFLCSIGDVNSAETEFNKAASNPFYETPEFALDNAGVCMLDAGRLKEAEKYLLEAVRRNPQFGNAFLHIAELRFKERRLTIAESYLDLHHKNSPVSSASLWTGLQIQRDRGDLQAADEFAKKLLNDFPNSQEAGALLAQPQ